MQVNYLQILIREIPRVLILLVLAVLFIWGSTPLALAIDFPAVATWGLFFGGCFIAVALSHLCRRLLFPRLDLQTIAFLAYQDNNRGAGLVFLGICIVLASFVLLTGSALRL